MRASTLRLSHTVDRSLKFKRRVAMGQPSEHLFEYCSANMGRLGVQDQCMRRLLEEAQTGLADSVFAAYLQESSFLQTAGDLARFIG